MILYQVAIWQILKSLLQNLQRNIFVKRYIKVSDPTAPLIKHSHIKRTTISIENKTRYIFFFLLGYFCMLRRQVSRSLFFSFFLSSEDVIHTLPSNTTQTLSFNIYRLSQKFWLMKYSLSNNKFSCNSYEYKKVFRI